MFGLSRWLRKAVGSPAGETVPNRRRTVSVPTVMPGVGRYRFPVVDHPAVDHPAGIGPDLPAKLDLLIRRSWGSREDNQRAGLVFNARLVPAGDATVFVTTLLRHVRSVAPRLHVPFMTPRIEISEIEGACGQFIETDGWVRLVLSTTYAARPAASRAILCHEMCHYILFANGIWLKDRADNERLTDVAMFVFGMGDIFLRGFKSDDAGFNLRGHRMGYLTDAEYRFLSREVVKLRTRGTLQSRREDQLRREVRNRLLGNDAMVERYLADVRKRFPGMTEADRIQTVLEDFNRGR
jgi:predicted SprT family Zn-dependent metalloprotease